jgi:hypothetical protein
MPHDMHGKPLTKGDLVAVIFEVAAVHPGEVDCNVALKATAPGLVAAAEYLPDVSCNARIGIKIDASLREVMFRPSSERLAPVFDEGDRFCGERHGYTVVRREPFHATLLCTDGVELGFAVDDVRRDQQFREVPPQSGA